MELEKKIEKLVKENPEASRESLFRVVSLAAKLMKETNDDGSYTQEEFNEFMDLALLGAIMDRVTS